MNPLQWCRILIVDDSQFFRTQMKKILSEADIGRRYYEAKDGQEAISQYIQNRPDLVLMDMIMPNIDGVKATQAIKKFDPNAKIIVFSSIENKHIVSDAIKFGATNYILKPFDSGTAVMAVSKIIANQK
jgi:two-component system chemotaxis response regulator CheY